MGKRLFWIGLVLLWGCSSEPPRLDLEQLRAEIHRQTNALRLDKGLAPLSELDSLNRLSRQHSEDMRQRNYFQHTNPDGLTPFDRLSQNLPRLLCVASGENIAMQGLERFDTQSMANQLMKLWRESPKHYQHLVSPQFWHLGVGLALAEDRLYATQTFAAALVELKEPLKSRYPQGQRVYLDFDYLAPFPFHELSAFWHTPNPRARIFLGDGRAYIGKGPLKPEWRGQKHFSLKLPLIYGSGEYSVKLGRKQAYFDAPYILRVED